MYPISSRLVNPTQNKRPTSSNNDQHFFVWFDSGWLPVLRYDFIDMPSFRGKNPVVRTLKIKVSCVYQRDLIETLCIKLIPV
jgi:hypothetical protein